MDKEQFERQMTRLRSEWKNSYGSERTALLWRFFQREDEAMFSRAVDYCFGKFRGAPLLDELNQAMEEVKKSDAQDRMSYGIRSDGYLTELQNAAKNTPADKEFVKQCMQLLKDKMNGKINQAQFLEGCNMLDIAAKKYVGAQR